MIFLHWSGSSAGRAWSASASATPSWPDTHAFLGKPTDTATGLDIIGARQYDPATGRFLSVDPVLDTSSPQTLAGYNYAADNPVTSSDPTGLCRKSMPDEPPVDCRGNPVVVGGGGGGNSGGGGGGNGSGGGGASGCEPWLAGCVGFTGGGAPLTGEQAYGPGYSPVPDVHPVAASYPVAAQAGSVDGPGCNPMLFKYGACPSESGAAGTTPQEVRQSALGALGSCSVRSPSATSSTSPSAAPQKTAASPTQPCPAAA